jgi:hypothetical protein
MVFNANFSSISAISGVHMVFNANFSSISAISGVHVVFNANFSSISAISWFIFTWPTEAKWTMKENCSLNFAFDLLLRF